MKKKFWVFFLFLSGCNVCKHCLNGDNNYCQRGGLRSTIGIHRNGGFAKYCAAPLEQVNKLPNEVTFEQGGLRYLHISRYLCCDPDNESGNH